MNRKSLFVLLAALLVASMVLSACGGAPATEAPVMTEEPAAPPPEPEPTEAPTEVPIRSPALTLPMPMPHVTGK